MQLQVMIQQSCGNFGVGLGQEVIALRLELFPQRPVILYNAVMHQRDTTLPVRVGIYIVGYAVGRPAGVSDPAMAGKPPIAAGGTQVGKPPCRLNNFNAAVFPQGNAGAVIAAVFQIFQPVQELFPGIVRPRITDDPTHKNKAPFPQMSFKRERNP